MSRLARAILLACTAYLLAACSALPVVHDKVASTALVAAGDAPLPNLARSLEVPEGLSAVRPLPLAHDAVAARLALIAQAQRSIDLQTFLLADDSVGRLMLRALRDAAERGVRVRVLIDDFYTLGLDSLLLGLAAHPNVELRLYNPFVAPRDSRFGRFVQLAGDFGRLNHRMHNKLFVVDGAFAIVGGRNLADDYFMRSATANFIDFEMLVAGALVPDLARHFDIYWNSERAVPLHAVAASALAAAELRANFEAATVRTDAPDTGPAAERPPTSTVLASRDSPAALLPDLSQPESGMFGFFMARATAHADPPSKLRESGDVPGKDSVAAQLVRTFGQVQHELIVVSPYFVPGQFGMDRIRELRARGVEVHVVTNATASSDMPVVSIGYERHRSEMLRLGVRLFEVSNERIQRDGRLRHLFKSSTGRLHAKVGFVDRRLLLVGSFNLDARSALINTEIGISVDNPALVRALLDFYGMESTTGVYELRLKPDGHSIEWVGRNPQGDESIDSDPEIDCWLRFKLWLSSLLVPEDLL
jgi:phosphatidylserine/phosphatidylglycerophosphate/cardiolipin synthase-like enzyme